MAEWGADRSYDDRLANLRLGVGPAGSKTEVRLDSTGDEPTVWDDEDTDKLAGDDGGDWFFAELDDSKLDDDKVKKLGNEFVDELDDPL